MILNPARARERRAWYFYDWANSGFATTAIALFLGPYITVLAKAAADSEGRIHPLGIAPFDISIDARSYWSYLISLSVILQVLVLPSVGALADRSGQKKFYLGLTAYIGAAAAAAMFMLEGSRYALGGVLFLIANISFGASIVVYNSFLPEIAAPEERDLVSARGWGVGYVGGGVLLALNLLLYQNAARLGLSESMAVRISLCSSGIWWALFTIPALVALQNSQRTSTGAGFGVLHTLREVLRFKETAIFLVAYLLYNDGVQAVLALAGQFANDELKIPVGTLTIAILMVQFIAFFGAIAFQWIAALVTAKRAIAISLLLWIATLVYIYAGVKSTRGFFVAAAAIAIVMGGSQALSRSLFAQLIPKGREAEYFSLYEISDKGTSWLSPLVFGLALQFTGSYRLAILSLVFFFFAGLLVLLRVNVERGEAAVLTVNS